MNRSLSSQSRLNRSLTLLVLLLVSCITLTNSQPTNSLPSSHSQQNQKNQISVVESKENNNNKLVYSPLTSFPQPNGVLNGIKYELESTIDWIGLKLSTALGFTSNQVDLHDEVYETTPISSPMIGWADSSVYVERTNSLHPSRPSSFGPHIQDNPLRGLLFPITTFSTSDSYGCENSNSTTTFLQKGLPTAPKEGWIALSQRGHCPFSQKVRFAASLGASAVLFGDQSAENGGLAGLVHLLTPFSGDDTRDIDIPSAFISRASYLSILQTYEAEQTLIEEGSDKPFPRDDSKPRGLDVTLAPDDLFTWPLLDFLLLLLFLPSILTGLTLFTQRIRQMRQSKLDRAPEEAVAQLPVFIWGQEDVVEKLTVGNGNERDEESSVGLEAVETTPLLSRTSTPSTPSAPSSFRRFLPRVGSFLLRPINPTSSTQLAPSLHPTYLQSCTECAICLSDFEKGERVVSLPCGHIFHAEEITEWLLRSKRLCPSCRASITVDDTPSEEAPALVISTSTSNTIVTPSIISTSTPIPPSRNHLLQNAGTRISSPVASSSSVTVESTLLNHCVDG